MSDVQIQKCITAFAAARGERGFSEDEVKSVVETLDEMLTDGAIAAEVLDGTVLPDWDGTELLVVDPQSCTGAAR